MKKITLLSVESRDDAHNITEVKCEDTTIGWIENFKNNRSSEERPYTAYSPTRLHGMLFLGEFYSSKTKDKSALDMAVAKIVERFTYENKNLFEKPTPPETVLLKESESFSSKKRNKFDFF